MIAASVARSPTLSRARPPPRVRVRVRVSRRPRARRQRGHEQIARGHGRTRWDIGARDPTAGEIESGFTSKVLGHADTDHILQVPTEMSDMVKIVNKACVADGA